MRIHSFEFQCELCSYSIINIYVLFSRPGPGYGVNGRYSTLGRISVYPPVRLRGCRRWHRAAAAAAVRHKRRCYPPMDTQSSCDGFPPPSAENRQPQPQIDVVDGSTRPCHRRQITPNGATRTTHNRNPADSNIRATDPAATTAHHQLARMFPY